MALDLSAVTDRLIDLVKNQWATAPIWAELGLGGPSFTPSITGLAPDRLQKDNAGPQLSVFLYHLESNNAQESSKWTPDMLRSPGNPAQYLPLALDLYYLVSPYSEGSYVEEQQMMSVALRIFHANGIVRSGPPGPITWELSLTMDHRSYDELSRLWQATTAALRLGVVYRATVLFLTPDDPVGPAKQVEEVDLRVKKTDASDPEADLVVVLP
ncbi:MAG TPA: DUF4255 domain-containing protein [Gaiellaceae bacterium]|jgi:hypothetical protein|nr:DUF4255 domain-containing protein [Gaiellaceae bacterium]